MTVTLLESAIGDLEEGFQFYETVHSGLGEAFLDSLSSDLETLDLYAGIHPKVYGLHRMLAHRFPFALYYEIIKNEVIVWAVLDCRRDPEAVQKKLRGRKKG